MFGIDARPLRVWQEQYGKFPDNYFAIDLETSGLDRNRDYVLQVGIVVVENRKAVFSHTHVINWPGIIDQAELGWLASRMATTKQAMAKQGKPYRYSIELLDDLGEPPEIVAIAVKNVLGTDPSCVGHYAWNFDYPRLYDFLKKASSTFEAMRENLYDSCLMTRACLANMAPGIAEPMNVYYERLNSLRGLPSCKLEDCVNRFQLGDAGVENKSAHEGGYDAWVSHLIFEKLREAADAG